MINNLPLKVISNDFAKIKIYKDYLISSIKEGLVINYEHLEWFYQLFDKYYPTKKFGYISNRMHDYSVNPVMYFSSSLHEKLSAVAIVCKSEQQKDIALYEKTFYKKSFNIFSNVNDAVSWVKTKI